MWLYPQSQESLNIKISSEESGTVAKGTASEDRELQVPQTLPLWHKGYFKLIVFKKQQT